jgi:putative membrane protein
MLPAGAVRMKSFVLHWFVLAVALGLATRLIGGVHVDSWFALAVAAFMLSLVNTVVRPVLTILTLPLTVITLGLFYLVVNGVAFGLAAWLTPGFRLDSFGAAILGAFVVGCFAWVLGMVLPSKK